MTTFNKEDAEVENKPDSTSNTHTDSAESLQGNIEMTTINEEDAKVENKPDAISNTNAESLGKYFIVPLSAAVFKNHGFGSLAHR